MERVIDIELWSSPKASALPLDGHAVAEVCRTVTGLSDHIVLGLSFIPDPIDVRNLEAAFREHACRIEDFKTFCAARALAVEASDEVSAASFLAFIDGQPLAWLHFPTTPSGRKMAALVHDWATRSGYVIRAGQGDPALTLEEVCALWDA